MNNVILSTRNIDSLISDIANAVIERLPNIPIQSNASNDQGYWMDINGLIDYLPGNPKKPTIYKKVRLGEIPHIKDDKGLGFHSKQIDEWLLSKARKTRAEISAEADNYLKQKSA